MIKFETRLALTMLISLVTTPLSIITDFLDLKPLGEWLPHRCGALLVKAHQILLQLLRSLRLHPVPGPLSHCLTILATPVMTDCLG